MSAMSRIVLANSLLRLGAGVVGPLGHVPPLPEKVFLRSIQTTSLRWCKDGSVDQREEMERFKRSMAHCIDQMRRHDMESFLWCSQLPSVCAAWLGT